eukprot:scaffold65338_cov39-Prasinocladus_malaysianus.AAC.1
MAHKPSCRLKDNHQSLFLTITSIYQRFPYRPKPQKRYVWMHIWHLISEEAQLMLKNSSDPVPNASQHSLPIITTSSARAAAACCCFRSGPPCSGRRVRGRAYASTTDQPSDRVIISREELINDI